MHSFQTTILTCAHGVRFTVPVAMKLIAVLSEISMRTN